MGRGWVEKHLGSRGVKDVLAGVNIDVLLTGEYPGDGLQKPVSFPDPGDVAVTDADGWRVLALPQLIELKLASGMTAPHRLQDLADVLQLVRVNRLGRDFDARLAPYVRQTYAELWAAAQHQDPYS